MAGCPTCGKHWPDDYQRCPEDGSALRASAMGITSAATGGPVPALAPKTDEDLPPGSIAGEYKIEKKIGEGGMGSVYGARHPVIGKRAAIKVIRRELSTNPEAVDRFVLEAQSVNQIGHPNIVDVFGFGQLKDGRSFFVMEWLDGESLRDRLHRPLPFPEGLEILEQIAKALQAAHDAGVVHRDLKPDNVYLHARKGDKPSVKLLDFGLAKLTGTTEGAKFDRTRTGMVMGTPLYLSPEQAKGAKIDAATDVYSLGAMAYEMFTGSVPFKADSAVEIMAMHISSPPTPLSEHAPWLPADLNHLILAMLDKDPRKRPPIAQVREALATIAAAAAGRSTPLPYAQPQPFPTPLPYGQVTPQTANRTPFERPTTPATGVPHQQTPSTPIQYQQTPSTPFPYQQQPTPSTPQMSPYASSTPGAATISDPGIRSGGGGKRALVIGGVVVAALAIAGGVFIAVGDDKTPVAKEQPTTTNIAVNDPTPPDPTPTPTPPDPTPTAGSNDAIAATGSAGSAAVSPPDTTKPDTTDTTKPDTTKPDATKPDPAKAMARVTITFSGPPKALVLVDGKPMGREAAGKLTFSVAPGAHTIRVQAKGFKPAEQKIRVGAGGSESVKLTLEKKRTVNSVEDPFAD